MPTAERWRKIRRRRRASRLLILSRDGKIPPERRAEVVAAARAMLLACNRKIGPKGRQARAAAGGTESWRGTTFAERSLEMRRRARVRTRNRIAKFKARN
jgi:hypothetical protein